MDNPRPVPLWFMRLAFFLINLGMLWFVAWWVNPNLTTGTVWFFGFIYASLMTALDELRGKFDA